VAIKVVASYMEDQIITTSPEEIMKLKQIKGKSSPQMPADDTPGVI